MTFAQPAGAQQGQQAWTLSEDLRIGGGTGPAALKSVGQIAVTANGNIFVVDNNPIQIKLFSPAGAFVRRVGLLGAGRGEYTSIGAMVVNAEGNVQVVIPEMGRVIVYSPAGDVVSQTTVEFSGFRATWDGVVTADGGLLDPIVVPTGKTLSLGAPETAERLQRVKADGTRGDTIPFPGCRAPTAPANSFIRFENADGSYISTAIPYLPRAQTVFAGDGTAWCAPGDTYSIFHFRVGRPDTVHTVHMNVTPPAVPDSERARALASLKATAARTKTGTFNEARIPKVLPTIAMVRVDNANRLWVRRTDTPASAPQFDVFDTQGAPLASVKTSLPWSRIPLVVGEYAYGAIQDAGGAPVLVRARIQR